MSERYVYRVGRNKAQIHDEMSRETSWWDITMLTPQQVEELRGLAQTNEPLPSHLDVALGRTALHFYRGRGRAEATKGLTKEQLREQLPALREREREAAHLRATSIKVIDTAPSASLIEWTNPYHITYAVADDELPLGKITQYQYDGLTIVDFVDSPAEFKAKYEV